MPLRQEISMTTRTWIRRLFAGKPPPGGYLLIEARGSADFVNRVTATVTVGGGGSATFTDSIVTIDQTDFRQAGFEDASFRSGNPLIAMTSNSLFATYDLTTSIQPPVSGSPSGGAPAYHTDQGILTFTNFGSTSTFGATLAPTAAPEPSSLTLLGLGSLGLAGYGRRRRKQSVPPQSEP
jgi:hypothetical protein